MGDLLDDSLNQCMQDICVAYMAIYQKGYKATYDMFVQVDDVSKYEEPPFTFPGNSSLN